MRIKCHKEPKLRTPNLICGLPGIGYVGKLSADYLITQLNAELFEEIYSPAFPPYVLIREDGTVELLKNEFYFWINKESENDLIIFTGNTQAVSPEGQFEIVDKILQRAEKLNVNRIISLAAYVRQEHVNIPRVFGAVTESGLTDELQKFEVLPMDKGSISGTNGLLFGHSKLRSIQSICLLGETPAYTTLSGQLVVDARAAKAVLKVLTKMLQIEVDMNPLEQQAKLTEDFVHRVEEMSRRAIDEARRTTDREVPRYYV